MKGQGGDREDRTVLVGRDTTHIKSHFCLLSLVVLYLRAVCDGLEYILHSS